MTFCFGSLILGQDLGQSVTSCISLVLDLNNCANVLANELLLNNNTTFFPVLDVEHTFGILKIGKSAGTNLVKYEHLKYTVSLLACYPSYLMPYLYTTN